MRIFALALVIGCSSPEPEPTQATTPPAVETLRPGEYRLMSNQHFEIGVSRPFGAALPSKDGRFTYTGMTTDKPVVIVSGGCKTRLLPPPNQVIDLDVVLTPYKAEKVCGEWAYSDSIKVSDRFFPSDFTDSTAVIRMFDICGVTFTDSTLTLITALDPTRGWRIQRGYDGEVLALTGIGPTDFKPQQGVTVDQLTEVIATATRGLQIFGKPITDSDTLVGKMRSASSNWHWVSRWYLHLAPEEAKVVRHAVASAAAPLARFVDRGLVDRYLLKLTWEDIVAADPLINYWPHDDHNAIVARWNMSGYDWYMRLWWGRRGRMFFEEMQKEVRAQVSAAS